MLKKLVFESSGWNTDSDKIVVVHNGDDIIIKKTKSDVYVSTTEKATIPAEEFLKKLEKIDILNWEDDYFAPVLDGESWRLKYYTTDGTKKYIHGLNAYPKEYDALMDLLLAEYEDAEETTTMSFSFGSNEEEELKEELEEEDIDFNDFLDADDEEKAEMLEDAGLDIEDYIQFFDDEDFCTDYGDED